MAHRSLGQFRASVVGIAKIWRAAGAFLSSRLLDPESHEPPDYDNAQIELFAGTKLNSHTFMSTSSFLWRLESGSSRLHRLRNATNMAQWRRLAALL